MSTKEPTVAMAVDINSFNAVSSTLRFRKVGNTLYGDKETSKIVGKESVSYDAFDFGLSQRLVKQGYKIAISGDI